MAHRYGQRAYTRKVNKIIRRKFSHLKEGGDYIGSLYCASHPWFESFKKLILLKFGRKECNVFDNYEYFLNMQYGDWKVPFNDHKIDAMKFYEN